jgi:glycosyltransferase involved in cell wall biosynthesis
VHAADLVVTCTPDDVERMIQLYGAGPKFTVVPQGFDGGLLDFDRARLRQRTRASLGLVPDEIGIVFVGGPAEHNRDAVRFLEEEVMPHLRRPARLLIAGRCSDRERRQAGGDPRIQRLGYVEDLRSLFAAGDVAVNPVRYGAGSNIKVAEYLAAGLPVVSTRVGMRGYEGVQGRLRVAELSEFANVLGTIQTQSYPNRTSLGERSWSSLGRRLYDTYAGMLE